ncbi:DUF6177 family protein [Streptomyces zingiberis]|uniref:Uncharacterized protein n=1 Tax=Streptomyces zingiberis TaxID=2053010 RepID=A0ABX1C6T0_9ACTN|nr:DUF6177 family protein [Streptomyces zingiberis]NJQ03895.1 hypothetical protein [Streptomyces zingiberis]
MTKDIIALTRKMPDAWSVVAGLLAGGPDLRLGAAGDGAVLQLCDEAGRPLVSVESPVLVQVAGETARLLGPDGAPPGEGPVWWVEARASTAVPEAERLAGAFAGRLAAMLDGTVWPPGAGEAMGDGDPVPPGVTAAPAPVAAQPAVDVLTGHAAVVIQDRPVIAMTAWLSDARRATLASGRGLQIVTPHTSRLTFATRSLLFAPPSRWVVQDGRGGYYDGLSGAVLRWRDGAFGPAPAESGETPVAEVFRDTAPTGERRLGISVRTAHPADDRLVLGGALEAVWQAVTGGPPAGWGTAEPVNLPWSRRRLTELAYQRAPEPTWAVAVGDPGRPATATLRVLRTEEGVEEDITFTAGYGEDEEPPLDALAGLAEELAARHHLVTLLAQVQTGGRDLHVPARLHAPPVPVAFALGAAEVREIGAGHARRPPLSLSPVELGPDGRHGLHYPLGDGSTADGWTRLDLLMRHLRRSPEPEPEPGPGHEPRA